MMTVRVVPAKLVSSLCLIITAATVWGCTDSNGPGITLPDDPLISLSSSSTRFDGIQAGAPPPAQTVTVSNGGEGTLSGLTATVTYTAGQPGGWLEASLSANTAPSTLTLTATTGSLPAGAYSASVAIGSSGTSNSPQTLSVSFTVAPAPAGAPLIALSSSSRSFTALQGGAAPAAQTVSITNAGEGTLSGLSTSVSYPEGQPGGWLSATLSGTTAPSTLTLAADPGSLAAGAYAATVTIASEVAGNGPETVTASLTVALPPDIKVSHDGLEFTAQQGGAAPAAQEVMVTNAGGGTLSGLTVRVGYRDGEPTGWLTAELSGTTAPSTLTVTVNPGSLTPGVYTGSAHVESPAAGNEVESVDVTFTVTPPSEVSETFYASADNFVAYNSRNPNAANAVFEQGPLILGSQYSIVNLFPVRQHHAVLMKFDVQSTITGKTILEAKLRLFQDNVPPDPRGRFRLNAIASSWSPSTVTWIKWLGMRFYGNGQVDFVALPSTATPIELDVTTIVQKWADGSFANHGLQIWEPAPVPVPSAEQAVIIQSLDQFRASDKRPQLLIRYQ
jgi:hypothetical protein